MKNAQLKIGAGLLISLLWAACAAAQAGIEVADDRLSVTGLDVTGADSLSTAELQGLRQKLVDQQESRARIVEKLRHELAVAVGNHGYLRARINVDVEPKDRIDPGHVVLQAAVQQGTQYRLRNFSFEGNHAFTSTQPQPLVPVAAMRDGDMSGLRLVYGRVNEFYHKAGFTSAKAVPHLSYDDGLGVIDLVVKIDEGVAPPSGGLPESK